MMIQRTLGIGATLVTMTAVCIAQDGPRQVLQAGTTRVVVTPWNRGLSISVDGVRVSMGSNMVVTKPPWTPHYYLGPSKDAVEKATQAMVEGGQRLHMSHRGEHEAFVGEDTITVTPGRVERVLDGHFTKDEGAALIQWQVAGLNPTLVIGRKYHAQLANGEIREGTVPVSGVSAEIGPSTFASGFTWIEFDSRIGPIRITVESEHKLICYDYRKNRWADPARPLIWLGDLGTQFKKGTPIRYRIVFDLPQPRTQLENAEPVRAEASIARCADAQAYPADEQPTLIPRPKEAEYGKDYLILAPAGANQASPVAVVRPDDPNRELTTLALAEWQRFLKERYALQSSDSPPTANGPGVRFEAPRPDAPALPPEGYTLDVAGAGAVLRAADTAGYLYGVQTLKQLTTVRPSGEVVLRAARIRDWPSLKFRGVHLFTGGQGPDLHIRLLQNVLAALKMNHLVLECEYINWDAHPEIHHAEYGMPKDDVRRVLAVSRALGIEVTPLVMSLGHCQWMFTNDTNLELAEDPDAKWAYCVTNPKTYDFIYEIYAEAVELFQPKWFHIGHDEFHHRGRVPYRESSKPYTVEQLFMMDTLRHHEWLTERGIRMMLWSDMLLGPGEGPDACSAASDESAAELRGKLPKDVVVADWHYVDTAPAKYVDVDKFVADGFTTVCATWSRPGNITHFARAAYEKKALGLLQTTWAGYSLDPKRFQSEIRQYSMYVLAAEAAWNADNPPDGDQFPAGAYFLDLMGLSTLKPANRAGWTADLRGACNYSLGAADAAGWFELGPEHDLSHVPGGRVRWKGIAFQLGGTSDAAHPMAIVLRSRLTQAATFPTSVEIAIGAPAPQLAFLQTTNFTCEPGAKVAEYEITYADGASTKVDLLYGQNVLAYTDPSAAAEAPVVWSGQTATGEPVSLRALIWTNPHPEKAIRALTVRSANAPGALVLLGLTGLDEPAASR